ncbi:MAG: S8 family peptidase [Chitinophagaceae bacterium]
MKHLLVLACLVCCTATLQAQYSRYVVQLSNKKGNPYTLSAPSAFLTAKAIERRNRYKIAYDSTDLPITPAYLDSIRNVPNVTILNVSKWLNQVLIKTTDASALATINSFTFVKASSAIAPRIAASTGNNTVNKNDTLVTPLPVTPHARVEGASSLDYGNMSRQINIHEGEYLHNMGYTGKGMTIAVIDGGFSNYKTNPFFDSVRLQGRFLGEWDFVNNEASVNEDNSHGALCLSTMAANKPGQAVGSAPYASFWLLRSEDTYSEYPVEEQNWAAAAEYADSVGVDIISTSLGYSDFDNASLDHSYAQRDGNTSIVSRAADLAAHKGILVTVSAGNSGANTTDLKYVACPADADSVYTVGAITTDSIISASSSWGPNGAGKLKPNGVSVGVGTVLVSAAGYVSSGTGTSFANPNVCGLIACLWQAFPEFSNMQIIDAVQKSSHKYNTPDYRYGYGIANFRKAYEILQNLRTPSPNYEAILGNQWMKAYPVPFENSIKVVVKAPATGHAQWQFTNIAGQIIDTYEQDVIEGQIYVTGFPHTNGLAKGVYFIRYRDAKNKQTISVMKR